MLNLGEVPLVGADPAGLGRVADLVDRSMRPGRSSASSSADGMLVAIMTRIRYLGALRPHAEDPPDVTVDEAARLLQPDSSVSRACSVPMPRRCPRSSSADHLPVPPGVRQAVAGQREAVPGPRRAATLRCCLRPRGSTGSPTCRRHQLAATGQAMELRDPGRKPDTRRTGQMVGGMMNGGNGGRHGTLQALLTSYPAEEAARLRQPLRPADLRHAAEAAAQVPDPRHDGDQHGRRRWMRRCCAPAASTASTRSATRPRPAGSAPTRGTSPRFSMS